MSIKVKTAKAHSLHLQDADVVKEVESVETELRKAEISFPANQISFLFIKGSYIHLDRTMRTACLFVNTLARPIRELHCIIRLQFVNEQAAIAKMTVNFDEDFIGVLETNEALLVHFGIPVKGLTEDKEFGTTSISGTIQDVRISYLE